jgi:hypothetical protein
MGEKYRLKKRFAEIKTIELIRSLPIIYPERLKDSIHRGRIRFHRENITGAGEKGQ